MQAARVKLEKRVSVLERKLRKVQSELKRVHETLQQSWWERLAGTCTDDALFDEIMKAGQEYRRSLVPRVPGLQIENRTEVEM